ncbi:hypothetical protein H4Q26_014722 [Puccinia striiformis f. sp. tritici PST-130]|nr:hypothetical protein H4Q26_014722 [Puccinia striiformis f. sp. tritici PST-130]
MSTTSSSLLLFKVCPAQAIFFLLFNCTLFFQLFLTIVLHCGLMRVVWQSGQRTKWRQESPHWVVRKIKRSSCCQYLSNQAFGDDEMSV